MHRIALRGCITRAQRLSSLSQSVLTASASGCILLMVSSSSDTNNASTRTTTILSKLRSYHEHMNRSKIRLTTSQCSTLEEEEEMDMIDVDIFSEPFRYEQALRFHRSLLPEYRARWEYSLATTSTTTDDSDENDSNGTENQRSIIRSTTTTPTSIGAWPKGPPTTPEQVSMMEFDLKFAAPGKYRDDQLFRIAAYQLNVYKHIESNKDNTKEDNDDDYLSRRALRTLQDLACAGHADAQCMLGIVFREGTRDIDPDPVKAYVWFKRAADEGNHMQACYEMGVALYMGEGGVPEQEDRAVEYFEKAASMGHAAAAYMYGDCLLDGVGVIRDRAEALEWLVAAGELGHRGARSRVLAVLESTPDDSGLFTDGSRQSFRRRATDVVTEEKKWTEEDLQRLVTLERQFTIGGGTRNPVILQRRKSVVEESRERQENEGE